MGYTFFRSKFFTDNIKGIYTFTKDFNLYPALLPPMKWFNKTAPSSARALTVKRGMSSDFLSWSGARDNSGANYLLYNVYASERFPVDISDARNLIATRYMNQSISIPHKGRLLHYAITATDRYGNESAPTFSSHHAGKPSRPLDFRELIMGHSLKKYK